MINIGIIREGKTPPDQRVPLTPEQCANLQTAYDVRIFVQPSTHRCYPNEAYLTAGLALQEDLSHCSILMGIKEVPIDLLLAEKTYLFFSHTIKKQLYNRPLLLAILEKRIRLIDFEALVDQTGKRVIAFGHFAGIVGAHNAIWTYAQRTKSFQIKRLSEYENYGEALLDYRRTVIPPVKIVLTGTGRVGRGAAQLLIDAGIQRVEPEQFLVKRYDFPVFTQIPPNYYVKKEGQIVFDKSDFYQDPSAYVSKFQPFYQVSDIMINGIFWEKRGPAFFTTEEMAQPDFKIQVIADVTCDIAPESSIPSTLRPSTIADPVYGFDPRNGQEIAPYQSHGIDMMAIDNLPSEIPRAASESFGEQLIKYVIPELVKDQSDLIDRGTVALKGELGTRFRYLKDFVEGEMETI